MVLITCYYQATINLIKRSYSLLRSADTQDLHISTTLPEYDGLEIEISEETWLDVVSGVKAIEITLDNPQFTHEPFISPETNNSFGPSNRIALNSATPNTLCPGTSCSELISTQTQTDEITEVVQLPMISESEVKILDS